MVLRIQPEAKQKAEGVGVVVEGRAVVVALDGSIRVDTGIEPSSQFNGAPRSQVPCDSHIWILIVPTLNIVYFRNRPILTVAHLGSNSVKSSLDLIGERCPLGGAERS